MVLQGVNTHCRAYSSKYSPEKNVLVISCSHLYNTYIMSYYIYTELTDSERSL